MKTQDEWTDQKVVILGAARQGTALARYLARHGAWVVLNDRRAASQLGDAQSSLAELEGQTRHQVEWVFGSHPEEILDGADLLCLSGGVPTTLPLVAAARRRGIPLSNDSQIFLEAAPCPVIGITGSAGKTTTTSLVGRMGQAAADRGGEAAPRRVWVGGNIGSPLIEVLDQMEASDLAVMELSSFQLEIVTRSPQVAAVLNITPNHLDRHVTMQAYTAAKARILNYQSPKDVAVLNRDDPGAWRLLTATRGRLVSFGLDAPAAVDGSYVRNGDLYYRTGDQDTWLLSRSEIGLRGAHNLQNVLAATAIAMAAGLSPESVRVGVQDFQGVPHRLEFVRRWHGADWYNDSIATAPERAMAAIRSFEEPLVLLAGGRDKDLPWEDFANLVCQRVRYVVVFGEAAGKIAAILQSACTQPGQGPQVERCADLESAVAAAARIVQPGEVVLLSPGGTSYDEFRDFEERGECFRRLVMQL